MENTIGFTGSILLLAVSHLSAATLYVSLGSTNPTPPYATWATAATNIQDAVDASSAGDTVLVTNGVYSVGQGNWGGEPSLVVITNATALVSVNGPQVTVINGGGTNRCASLSDGTSLSGFTLTNGVDYIGSGGGGVWCSSTNAFLTNCVIVGNSTVTYATGGGAYGCTLHNCTLTGNVGGGASSCTLYNCTLTGNSAADGYGGGAWFCTLYNCTLTANVGGGASFSTLYNCTLTGNSADYGGGASASTLYNCTLTGNVGGGAGDCTLYNCIVYFNTASGAVNYDSSSTLNYCCTTPLPTSGIGNIAVDPQLASASHLSADSPCRGVGSAAYATGTDIDGEPWGNPPSIGCDEYHPGAVTGPLTVSLLANDTNAAVGYAVSLTALIEGRTTVSVWDFGDGEVAMNEPYITHSWTQPGDYLVALWAFNESNFGGASATLKVHVLLQPVCYVAATSTNPQPPYTSWATAATNIQDAVDAAAVGGTVLVSNGVYATGERAAYDGTTNRVEVDKPLTLRSVNGPQFTVINGGGTTRCVSLTDEARLSGFTLTNGSPGGDGGGVWCWTTNAFLTNCVIVGNWAIYGGGAYECTLYNCVLSGNSASGGDVRFAPPTSGGGACASRLYNCTVTGNSAGYGGGADSCTLYNCTLSGNQGYTGALECTLYNCTLTGNQGDGASGCTLYNCTLTENSPYGAISSALYNCIVYFNTASGAVNYDSSSTLNYCCTTPQPTNGVGNITNSPLFVDYANDNLRLQSNSSCINAGNNAYVSGTADLDGNPRIVSGTVDIGAYEYQGSGSVISYAWLQQYGLPTDGSADYADPDHDGMNNWQEWICGTNPTNALSVLKLTSATPTNNPPGTAVTWESVSGIIYTLQRSSNLAAQPAFSMIQTNIVGLAATTTYTDTNAAGAGPFFYRVGVSPP